MSPWGKSIHRWSCLPYEKLMHVNVLELKANWLALKLFVKTSLKHIEIMPDNTTTIHCINKMGTSHLMECHRQVLKLWKWAIIHKNHLSAGHNARKLNAVADKYCRSKSCWYWIDAPIKDFESGIRIFMFQIKSRSICYQY